MPLLKKKIFQKAGVDDKLLRDDEEVFHCTATNEIFRDYEEFCERIMLVNSLVWSCSMTGKSNLTYVEALQSEENARKNIKDFPMELYRPVLYLASKTKRTSFNDMAEDVFIYMKDRYFVGEIVEASFTGNKWLESHVLQVIAPNEGQIKASAVKNGSKNTDRQFYPPASCYRYEIEQLDADDADVSQIMVVDHSQIRRRKSMFSREKHRIFLKQFVEQLDTGGPWIVKESVMTKYGIHKMQFDQIFDGPLPDFDPSKKLTKKLMVPNGKKDKGGKQETLAKFLEKNSMAMTGKNKKNLIEEMKKREEEFKQRCIEAKQKKQEEKMLEKQKRREENIKVAMIVKDWNKAKEDLELEDHKKIPEPVPIVSKIPMKYYGDALMVVEFVNSFSKLLSTKDFFSSGLTIELMEKALFEKEVAGSLTDLVQMLLVALFNVQDEETSQYTTTLERQGNIKEEELADTLFEATQLATKASHWSKTYQGLPIGRLPMYSLTVSEILRLHLLGSGARIKETGAKWRYQQRGGYTSEDDPGLNLRVKQPHILKALANHYVTELSIGDKLKVLSCLIHQLLTYADVRDIIEERLENTRQVKMDLRSLQAAEKRREQEYVSNKMRIKKEGKDKEDKEEMAKELTKLAEEAEKKKEQFETKNKEMAKKSTENQIYLGMDRGFRRYIKLETVPAFFVEDDEENSGRCLDKIVPHNPELVDADDTDVVLHIRRLYEEMNSGDKENTPSTPKKVNGWRSSLKDDVQTAIDLHTCTANPQTCPIHSNKNTSKWGFYSHPDDVGKVINSLNKRGIRESELRNILINEESALNKITLMTPVHVLTGEIKSENDEEERKLRKDTKKSKDCNLGYPTDMETCEVLHLHLVENILEMEEKLYAGNLGQVKVKNRDLWRKNLAEKKYEELDLTLIKRPSSNASSSQENDDGSRPSTPETKDKCYKDPGRYLGATIDVDSDNSDTESSQNAPLLSSEEYSFKIKCLATVLAQVAQAVDSKYLKKPLGHADVTKKMQEESTKKQTKNYDVLEFWEQSLLAATSYSQIFLHYGTLDSCIMWTRSALLARCRICSRKGDYENMLLCDTCNKGNHLYCLKPKLTSIPEGDWFCPACSKEKQKMETPKPIKKFRRIFTEEEEDLDVETLKEEENINENSEDVCSTCGTEGIVLSCDSCPKMYHLECAQPPLRRPPRGKWLCHKCKDKKPPRKEPTTRNGNSSNSGDDDSPVQRRSARREAETREDLPLHNASLQELLSDIMKHSDVWPFSRPVQKNEVPDYYDVIEKPMDFGTIKYKLNMGDYKCDNDFMADTALVFENCNTYNDSDATVYKCGVRLLKYFIKRCKTLGLKIPEDLDEETEDSGPTKPKKRRTF